MTCPTPVSLPHTYQLGLTLDCNFKELIINSFINCRKCLRTTNAGFLNKGGLENTTWASEQVGPPPPHTHFTPFRVMGPAGSRYQIFPIRSAHELGGCSGPVGGRGFVALRQEAERNSLPFYGSTRQAKREAGPSATGLVGTRANYRRESEFAPCKAPTQGEGSRVLAPEEKVDCLSLSFPTFAHVCCLWTHCSKGKTWASREHCFTREKGYQGTEGPASASEHRPTAAPPMTSAFCSCPQGPLKRVRVGHPLP